MKQREEYREVVLRQSRRKKSGAQPGLVLLLMLLVAGVVLGGVLGSERGTVVPVAPEAPAIEGLALREFDPAHVPYARAEFGQRWSDDVSVELGHNGCDTRNDILARDLESPTFKPRTRDCVVLTGTLHDPYTGEVLEFQRGQGTSELVQIDHVVALADAWYSGASTWTPEKRRDFANDPRNLQATTQKANQEKKAKTIDQWQPSNEAYRCDYALRILEVKSSYQLSVLPAEAQELHRVLAECSQQQ